MPFPRTLAALSTGAVLAAAIVLTGSSPATADPGVDSPTSYFPSEASLADVPTYLTDRAAVSPTGTINGQDYDHYCRADHRTETTLAGSTSGQTTQIATQVSSLSTAPYLEGNNGLLFTNQWWNGPETRPFFRVVWATHFATTNSQLVLQVGDNWNGGSISGGTFTPYSTDPATLVGQVDIWAGASKFRTSDWSVYVLGMQNSPPYAGADHYIPGPYTGVDPNLFSVNPTPTPPTTQPEFNDPYYPNADEYLPNVDPDDPNSFVNNMTYDPEAKTITIDLGDQPADAMIVFGISGESIANPGASSNTNEAFEISATFTADYVAPHPENSVCYPVSVSWDKVDAETSAPLPGSTWALTPQGDTAAIADVITAADGSSTDADPAGGGLTVGSDATALQPGTWTLTETAAPTGYTAAAGEVPVRLDFDNQSVELGAIGNTNTAPTITAPPATIEAGSTFTPLSGVTAADTEDGDLTSSVTVTDTGGFDANVPGSYTITYAVTDAGGKTTTVTRTVTVAAAPAPPAPAPAPQPVTVAATGPLAVTGTSIAQPAWLAASLLLTGAVALIAGRRRAD